MWTTNLLGDTRVFSVCLCSELVELQWQHSSWLDHSDLERLAPQHPTVQHKLESNLVQQ
jgi:hypothetical protein